MGRENVFGCKQTQSRGYVPVRVYSFKHYHIALYSVQQMYRIYPCSVNNYLHYDVIHMLINYPCFFHTVRPVSKAVKAARCEKISLGCCALHSRLNENTVSNTMLSWLSGPLNWSGKGAFTWNKSDISYLKTSQAFDVLIHSVKPNSVG